MGGDLKFLECLLRLRHKTIANLARLELGNLGDPDCLLHVHVGHSAAYITEYGPPNMHSALPNMKTGSNSFTPSSSHFQLPLELGVQPWSNHLEGEGVGGGIESEWGIQFSIWTSISKVILATLHDFPVIY